MRVAAIDLGTNTTRLLVADLVDGDLREVVRRSTITRLGEGVDERRRLLPLPVARTRNCLSEYRREIEALGAERALLIATSAVRDAENGEAFLGEIEWSYGFETQLLTGDEEAELMLRGVGDVGDGTLVVDVGGGSTELVTTSSRTSVDVGSVRLTERFLHTDPPTLEELEACAGHVWSVLPTLDVTDAIGVAGTITSIAALSLELEEYDRERVHGSRVTSDDLQQQLERLATVPLTERRKLRPLDPDRAPVIVAGAVIAREIVSFFEVKELEVSERDILDGAVLAAAELPEQEEGAAPPGAYTCC